MTDRNLADRDLVVFGARSGTGLELVRLACAAGWRVVAAVRPGGDAGALRTLGCAVVEADALDAGGVAAALAAARPGAVVASTLGGRAGGPPVDHPGNVAVIDAARRAGAERMMLVTSLGCGDSRAFASARLLAAIGGVLAAKTLAEEHLRASGLPFTIVRPGWLIADPPTGQGVLFDNPRVHGQIARPDLAAVVLSCLSGGRALGRTLSALDRTRLSGDERDGEFVPAEG